jgi:asparagine synthetase B (glutamine-hydrolysing)
MRREVEGALADIASLPAWDPAHACVILSGGLDTSVVAEIGRDVLGLKAAFTVLTGDEATDRPYAAAVAQRLGMQHIVLELR